MKKRTTMTFKEKFQIWATARLAKSSYRLSGIIIPIDHKIMSDWIIYRISKDMYETKEAKMIQSIVQKDDTVLEFGGGIGLISALAAKLAKNGKVVSVEANPKLIPFIRSLHKLNGVEVEIINAAISGADSSHAVPFYLRKDFWASSMSKTPNNYAEVVDVPMLPILDVVRQYNPTVAIIDIEGGEAGLIESDWCAGIRTVLMELHPAQLGLEKVNEIRQFFMDKGFSHTELISGRQLLLANR